MKILSRKCVRKIFYRLFPTSFSQTGGNASQAQGDGRLWIYVSFNKRRRLAKEGLVNLTGYGKRTQIVCTAFYVIRRSCALIFAITSPSWHLELTAMVCSLQLKLLHSSLLVISEIAYYILYADVVGLLVFAQSFIPLLHTILGLQYINYRFRNVGKKIQKCFLFWCYYLYIYCIIVKIVVNCCFEKRQL